MELQVQGRFLVSENEELFDNEHYNNCSVEQAMAYLNTLDEIQVDTETEGFDPHVNQLLSIQFGDKAGENQFLFPYSKEIMPILKPLLEDKSKLFVFQNAQFDLRFFRHHGIIITKVYDTFLAECLLNTDKEGEELEVGLDSLVFNYTGNLLNKSIRGNIHREGLSSRVIVYGCEDVKYMSIIKEKQIQKLEELELMAVMELENRAVVAFAAMCYNGIRVDKEKWKEVIVQVKKDVISVQDDLDNTVVNNPKLRKFCKPYSQEKLFFGMEERKVKVNWTSNVDKKNILVALVGNSIEDVGDRTLQKHKKKFPLVSKLIDFNKLKKLESSFGDKFLTSINKVTKRVHAQVWQIKSTGRISVSKPNLNQIPSKGQTATIIRECFIPREGNVMVGGDYSGFELRIIAEFSEDPLWVNSFLEGKDLHSVLCCKTFKITEDKVKTPFPLKPEMTYRDVQKTVNFGLAYGMSEFKLADTLGISVKEAKIIIDNFFKIVPRVKALLDMFGSLAKKHGRIRTAAPFRRIRQFKDWELAVEAKDFVLLGEIERAGKNSPIQGTNADIIKLAIATMQEEIDANGYNVEILLSVYDEIRTECPREFAEFWKDRMNAIMKESAETVLKKVPVVVDCTITDCWKK